MKVTVGSRLRSQVCDTEVVVVRAPAGELGLVCGGEPFVPAGAPRPHRDSPGRLRPDGGNQLGKRYTDAAGELELLVIKPGDGLMAVNGTALTRREAKPLPASD